jgi:iron(II)-dependent oxidoreductase
MATAVIAFDLMAEFTAQQALLLDSLRRDGPARYRTSAHPDLSPSGWHLGHCVYTENYWVREALLGLSAGTPALRSLYLPELSAKPTRGQALPPFDELLGWAETCQADNRRLLTAARSRRSTHPLLKQDYLLKFLIQHYAQHYETLCQVHAQLALSHVPTGSGTAPLSTARLRSTASLRLLPGGRYTIGGKDGHAPYDNEYAPHASELRTVYISAKPVTNAEFMAFIAAGGYSDRRFWSQDGWRWRKEHKPRHPEYWRGDDGGNWQFIGPEGSWPLNAEAPVCGICQHEAAAYAAWAGARLPHEYEWESAARAGLLEGTGQVWEWCANALHPYPGFHAFPYAGYSTPYFDGKHYTLRGGSRHTRPAVRRLSFRNFYPAAARHIFAGLRLAYDTPPADAELERA